jgi:hypothetical protein
MPDITDVVFPGARDAGIYDQPPPLSLQFRHRTVGGVSPEADNIEFPWYWTRLNHPAVDGRPNAILTVTPVGQIEINEQNHTASLRHNPHPVGVVYRLDHWYIYNLGLEAMSLGAEFNVAIHEAHRE